MKIEPFSVAITAVVAAFLITAGPNSPAAAPCPATAATAGAAPGTVSTTVQDHTSGRPVVGALVTWNFSGHAMTGSTDSEGHFAFRIPVADQKNGEPVKLTIQRNGYSP